MLYNCIIITRSSRNVKTADAMQLPCNFMFMLFSISVLEICAKYIDLEQINTIPFKVKSILPRIDTFGHSHKRHLKLLPVITSRYSSQSLFNVAGIRTSVSTGVSVATCARKRLTASVSPTPTASYSCCVLAPAVSASI